MFPYKRGEKALAQKMRFWKEMPLILWSTIEPSALKAPLSLLMIFIPRNTGIPINFSDGQVKLSLKFHGRATPVDIMHPTMKEAPEPLSVVQIKFQSIDFHRSPINIAIVKVSDATEITKSTRRDQLIIHT